MLTFYIPYAGSDVYEPYVISACCGVSCLVVIVVSFPALLLLFVFIRLAGAIIISGPDCVVRYDMVALFGDVMDEDVIFLREIRAVA